MLYRDDTDEEDAAKFRRGGFLLSVLRRRKPCPTEYRRRLIF